jgi:hypothetical protein
MNIKKRHCNESAVADDHFLQKTVIVMQPQVGCITFCFKPAILNFREEE